MSKCVLLVFFSGTFILSDVIFRFLNHIEFIYINIVWGNFLISLFHIYLSSFASTSYWRSCLFFTVHSFFLCHRLSIGVLFHFIYLCVCFCAKTMLFHYFVIWSLGWLHLQLCSFSSKLVQQFRILLFHMSFRIFCSTSVKNVLDILIGIALNL